MPEHTRPQRLETIPTEADVAPEQGIHASRELEAKMAFPEDAELPAPEQLTGRDGLQVSEDRTFTLSAVYWDTWDLRLLRRGHTIRHRTASDDSEDGWTLKLKAPPAAHDHGDQGGSTGSPIAQRDELTVNGQHLQPPHELADLVAAFVRHEPLRPVATLVTTRRLIRLCDDGHEVLEVTDDRVVPVVDGEERPAFRELEVELRDPGRTDLLRQVVQHLRESGAGTPDGTPKLARALHDRLQAGEDDATEPELGPAATQGDLVRAAVAAGTQRLLLHDTAVRIGDDDEAVHQARVATRRLRSDLKTLAPVLRADRVNGLRSELAWLGGLLGRVRDLDVLAARLRHRAAELRPEDRAGLEGLLQRLADERDDARRVLLDVLRGRRYLDLVDDLVEASARPPFRPDIDPDQPARPVAEKVARQAWDRLAKAVGRLPGKPSDPELHEVRKRAKRARYAMELVAPVDRGRPNALAKRLAKLQDRLGELQDAVTADKWLRDQIRALSPAAAFAAGALSRVEANARSRARKSWQKAWRRARLERAR